MTMRGKKPKEREVYVLRMAGGILIEVTREVYLEWYQSRRREKYQRERDQKYSVCSLERLREYGQYFETNIPAWNETEETALQNIQRDSLQKMLKRLPEKDAQLIILLYYEQITVKAAAEFYGCSRKAIQNRRKRILNQLLQMIQESTKHQMKERKWKMGCYSWIYSDIKKPMLIGNPGILVLPDGGILETGAYRGYGIFAGKDVYEQVMEWNRPYLSQHPEHFFPGDKKSVSGFFWYPVYADMSIPLNQVIQKLRDEHKTLPDCYGLREIGIDIACEDKNNQSLPFPIKICRFKENADYKILEPSLGDSGQGL